MEDILFRSEVQPGSETYVPPQYVLEDGIGVRHDRTGVADVAGTDADGHHLKQSLHVALLLGGDLRSAYVAVVGHADKTCPADGRVDGEAIKEIKEGPTLLFEGECGKVALPGLVEHNRPTTGIGVREDVDDAVPNHVGHVVPDGPVDGHGKKGPGSPKGVETELPVRDETEGGTLSVEVLPLQEGCLAVSAVDLGGTLEAGLEVGILEGGVNFGKLDVQALDIGVGRLDGIVGRWCLAPLVFG